MGESSRTYPQCNDVVHGAAYGAVVALRVVHTEGCVGVLQQRCLPLLPERLEQGAAGQDLAPGDAAAQRNAPLSGMMLALELDVPLRWVLEELRAIGSQRLVGVTRRQPRQRACAPSSRDPDNAAQHAPSKESWCCHSRTHLVPGSVHGGGLLDQNLELQSNTVARLTGWQCAEQAW